LIDRTTSQGQALDFLSRASSWCCDFSSSSGIRIKLPLIVPAFFNQAIIRLGK